MKAIFTGSIYTGFDLTDIVPDDAAAAVLESIDAPHAEAITIDTPSFRCGTAYGNPEGRVVVVFCEGLSSGVSVYGPWVNPNDAEEWAEDARRSGEEWQVFECPSKG
ncbi:hypothetical protein [Burkholderia gladioli]|uniref:hypothetical protein n=1 Tax=Burkholderia gladioli TaxID=28095 RepID=UPI00164041CD|nr:hypothetical protein [Burkholderia gladioli]HDR9033324.1 hypothetical protein [Burkholderia vietnamiensis]